MIPEPEWEDLKEYIGKWVAVADGKVVAAGDTAKEVYEKGKKYIKSPLIFQVPDPDEIYLLYNENN